MDPPLRLRHNRDYTDHFLDLFRSVMRDRLRTDRVGILMSGGLDSTGMAAIARELAGSPPAIRLSAHTIVADKLVPEQERFYAGVAAAHLGIPLYFQSVNDYSFFEAYRDTVLPVADPVFVPYFGPARQFTELGAIASQGTGVALYGEGPDNALHYDWKTYVKHELAQGHFGYLLKELASFPFLFRKVPFWTRLRIPGGNPPTAMAGETAFPSWLAPEFVKRFDLRERYERLGAVLDYGDPTNRHPLRPTAFASFALPLWQSIFEGFDPGVTRIPVEVRHPFVDIRMLRFLLAVPVLPWCRGKYVMRRALAPYLPDRIIRRPKTGLPGFPLFESWKRHGLPESPALHSGLERVADFVDIETYRQAANLTPNGFGLNLRPLTLNLFLRGIDLDCIL